MICSFLKWFKVYTLITSLYTTNSTVITDRGNQPIAITHQLNYPSFHLSHNLVVLQDKKYIPCFVDHKHKFIILDKYQMGIEVDHLD